ncbi:MAG: 50S ribosomal protein L10 [Actinomycetota bacterium]
MERTPRPDKVAVVDEVRDRLGEATATIITEYRGLDVKAMQTLRADLRQAGGSYKIYKNTLARLAARELELADLEPLLSGPTALAFVEDDVAKVAKALREFAASNENLAIKGGVLGGVVIDAAQVAALADLPSREELLAKLAGGFKAPTQQFAGLLSATTSKFAYGLQALITERESADAAA